jgi:hypothetical protein
MRPHRHQRRQHLLVHEYVRRGALTGLALRLGFGYMLAVLVDELDEPVRMTR